MDGDVALNRFFFSMTKYELKFPSRKSKSWEV